MNRPDSAPIETTPCMHCGRPVDIYPPEDGQQPFTCGQCAGTATAQPLDQEQHP